MSESESTSPTENVERTLTLSTKASEKEEKRGRILGAFKEC